MIHTCRIRFEIMLNNYGYTHRVIHHQMSSIIAFIKLISSISKKKDIHPLDTTTASISVTYLEIWIVREKDKIYI